MKAARHVNERLETDDRGTREREALGVNRASAVRFDDLGLAIDNEAKGATERNHREGLERRVQCETTDYHERASLCGVRWSISRWLRGAPSFQSDDCGHRRVTR